MIEGRAARIGWSQARRIGRALIRNQAAKILRIGDRGRGLPSDRAALDAETNKDAKWERSGIRFNVAVEGDAPEEARRNERSP